MLALNWNVRFAELSCSPSLRMSFRLSYSYCGDDGLRKVLMSWVIDLGRSWMFDTIDIIIDDNLGRVRIFGKRDIIIDDNLERVRIFGKSAIIIDDNLGSVRMLGNGYNIIDDNLGRFRMFGKVHRTSVWSMWLEKPSTSLHMVGKDHGSHYGWLTEPMKMERKMAGWIICISSVASNEWTGWQRFLAVEREPIKEQKATPYPMFVFEQSKCHRR